MFQPAIEFLAEAALYFWPFGEKRWWVSLLVVAAIVVVVVIVATIGE